MNKNGLKIKQEAGIGHPIFNIFASLIVLPQPQNVFV